MRPSDWFAYEGITASKFDRLVQALEDLEPLTRQAVVLAACDEDDLEAFAEGLRTIEECD